jgi:hypothetical protein
VKIPVAAVLIACGALAQQLEVRPLLRAGDGLRLEILRTRENSSRPQQNAKGRSTIELRVISVDADGVEIDWTPGKFVFEDPKLANHPLLLAATGAIDGLRVRLRLNAAGEVAGVVNRDEVLPKVQAALDVLVTEVKKTLPRNQHQALASMVARVASPELLLGEVTRDAQIYFALNGVELTLGDAVELQLDQPNPFSSGDTLPVTIRLELESASDDSAIVATTTTYDSAALAKLTRSLVEKSGAPVAEEKLANMPLLEVADVGRYVYDKQLGLMREVVVTRRSSAGGNRRLDRWEIRLVAGPRR